MKEWLIITFLKKFGAWGYLLGYFFFDYLDIPAEAMKLLVALIALDVFTGCCKVLAWKAKEFTSRGIITGLLTKAMTLIVILVIAILSQIILLLFGVYIGIEHFLSVTIGLFSLAEGYSILQNIYVFKTGKDVTEYDAVTGVIRFLQARLRNIAESIIKKP